MKCVYDDHRYCNKRDWMHALNTKGVAVLKYFHREIELSSFNPGKVKIKNSMKKAIIAYPRCSQKNNNLDSVIEFQSCYLILVYLKKSIYMELSPHIE